MNVELPNITVTFVIEFEGKFLLVYRGHTEKNFSSLWAFPGGKCEIGETIIDTIKREVFEETGLELSDEGFFLDSYYFKKTIGVAFLVRAKNDILNTSEEIVDYKWVKSVNELNDYQCIPGIHNHLERALTVLKNGYSDSLDAMNLTPDKYLNK
jgi:mutator protein MutT